MAECVCEGGGADPLFRMTKAEFDKTWREQGKTCATCNAMRKRNEKAFAMEWPCWRSRLLFGEEEFDLGCPRVGTQRGADLFAAGPAVDPCAAQDGKVVDLSDHWGLIP
jgi:hypothetical protein